MRRTMRLSAPFLSLSLFCTLCLTTLQTLVHPLPAWAETSQASTESGSDANPAPQPGNSSQTLDMATEQDSGTEQNSGQSSAPTSPSASPQLPQDLDDTPAEADTPNEAGQAQEAEVPESTGAKRGLGGRNITAYTRRQDSQLLGTSVGGYFDTEYYFPTWRTPFFDNHHLILNLTVMPTTWMEPGLGAYGTFYPNDEWEMNYDIYLSQGLTDLLEDGRGLIPARPSLSVDNNANKAISGRLGLSPFIGLDLGLGGYFAAIDPEGRKNLGMLVADATYTLGPWEFLAEGGGVFFDPITHLDAQGQSQTLKGPMWGYYLEGHYHFFPEFLKNSFLGRDFEKAVFTAFARISQADTDASVLNYNDRLFLTLGLNYRPTPNTAIKLEYQWAIETEALVKGDPSKEVANDQIVASLAVGF
jgi:hypothetical protein